MANPIEELFDSEDTVKIDDPFTDAKEVPSVDDKALLDILSAKIDPAELAQKSSELYLDTGLYVWEKGKVTVRPTFNDKDKASTDRAAQAGHPEHGRFMIHVSGTVMHTATQRKGRFNFSCSPDVRHQRDRQNNITPEIDQFHRRYLEAVAFYFKKYEKQPETEQAVIDMLSQGLYYMYITKGSSGGNFFNGFREM